MIFISAHSDTNFNKSVVKITDGSYVGFLDNFVGVYAAMKALFSGEIKTEEVRIELTYGEEKGLIGAKEIAPEIQINDLVVVIDVTGTPTDKDIVIEKCKSDKLEKFLNETLDGMEYDLYKDCPDPISDQDEVEVYKHYSNYTFFLGLPCVGGDYNSVHVSCKIASVDAVAKALVLICNNYENFKKMIQ